MNLKKVAQTVLLIAPIVILSGCEEWKADEKLVQNIWQEVVKITELNPDTPMPQVVFLKKRDRKAFGKFYPQDKKIEIYLWSIRDYIWVCITKDYISPYHLSYGEGEAFIYDTVAKLMLYEALNQQMVPQNYWNRRIKEKGYLLSLIQYTNDYLKINAPFKPPRNGNQEYISMKLLDLQIELEIEREKDEEAKSTR